MNVKHLMAMRTQLDAIQIQLDAMIEEALEPKEEKLSIAGCKHKTTVDVTTMGEGQKRYCKDCGETVLLDKTGQLTRADEGGI